MVAYIGREKRDKVSILLYTVWNIFGKNKTQENFFPANCIATNTGVETDQGENKIKRSGH